MTGHRVLCFGGRAFVDTRMVDRALSQLPTILGGAPFAIVHGGARGADTLCGEWAKARGIPVARVDADWDFYGKKAGPIRNQWMLEFFQPTYAIGFPGGVGTRDMQLRLDQAKVPLWLVH